MPTAAAPRGQFVQMLLKDESAYGTAATGDYQSTILYDDDLADLAPREEDNILGTARTNGRDSMPTVAGLPQGLSGNITAPLDLNHLWFWLKGAFGAPTTTGSGSDYVHTFVSGGEVLPHRTIEAKRTSALFYQRTGCLVNSLGGDMARAGGFSRISVGIMGRKETKLTSTSGGTPPSILDRDPLPAVIAALKIDTVAVADVISLNYSYSNNARAQDYLGDSEGYPTGHDMDDPATFSGSMRVRFRNSTHYDKAKAGTLMAFELLWSKSSTRLLSLAAPLVRFDPVGVPVTGPGRIEQTFNFKAEQDSSHAMLTAVLKNSQAAAAYA